MKTNEALDGTAQDGAKGETFTFGGLCQLVTEIPSDATHTRDRHLRMTIGTDVIAEEIAEVLDHDLLHGII